ncbi:sensor histidine kinase [Gulosibacter chungangensis]|uniref:sensor histidine kinase n=1 Tax=Gulosibacter chungangensis TaxID=979746 RepID=UPI001787991E|nr:histidine kinase [Gulosibacter chungangensis]
MTSRVVWITVAYVIVAIGLCLVPRVGIEWFPASSTRVLAGGILAVIVMGGVHLFRMRWPASVAILGIGVMVAEVALTGTTSVGTILIECDALYNLVLLRSSARSQRILSIIASVCLALAGLGMLLESVLPVPLMQMNVLLLAAAVTLWWGITVRTPTIEAERERERAALIAEAAEAKQREALATERMQISRELHDTISGHLSAIAMQSAAATASPDPLDARDLTERLSRVRGLSLAAMADMRKMIDVLRSDTATPSALSQNWSAVAELIELTRAAGVPVTLAGDDLDIVRLDPLASVAAFNVVREALLNATKHAPGSPVTVDVRVGDEQASITVTNPYAEQHDRAASSGYGLLGLSERVRLSGGDLEIDRENATWTVRALLPLTTQGVERHA